jgi:hypothetical protein
VAEAEAAVEAEAAEEQEEAEEKEEAATEGAQQDRGNDVSHVFLISTIDRPIPNEFICPITLELMQDPVIAKDGHTYERGAILDWFRESKAAGRGAISPKTGDKIGRQLVPNHGFRALITDHLEHETICQSNHPQTKYEPTGTEEMKQEAAKEAIRQPRHHKQSASGDMHHENPHGMDAAEGDVVEAALTALLASLNLSQYLHTFADEGYDELNDVAHLTVDQLIADIGMKQGHARRLARHFGRS